MKYCILLIVLCSCAFSHRKTVRISGFETQVNAFIYASYEMNKPALINDIIIQFTSELTNANGMCTLAPDTTPLITINSAFWNKSSDETKEILIFHELGHCVLHRGHRDGTNSDGWDVSIMATYSYKFESPGGQYYYEQNRERYIEELFNY